MEVRMKFKSRYTGYGFYVDGDHYRFSNGVFNTEDEAIIEVLKTLSDVEFEEEKAEAPAEEVAEVKPKANKSSKK